MNIATKRKIVLLGMLSQHPQAGMVWLIMQYLVGLSRLGFEVYYVETHGTTPRLFIESGGDGSQRAAAFIDRTMRRFGFQGGWAFKANHSDGACYGLSRAELLRLYQSAELLINMHGGTIPSPEQIRTGRLAYLGTDPVQTEIAVHRNDPWTIHMLSQHSVFFTWALNYGAADCRLPKLKQFEFLTTRQPIVLDFWPRREGSSQGPFTTVASWKQLWRDIQWEGEVYRWSKHLEFLKFLKLPTRAARSFELALAGCSEPEKRLLEKNGWRVREAAEVSRDLDTYRNYIADSRAEFTVAKDQNVRLRSGWFSDRSASYLACGRPVVTQATGFSNVLPTGVGLFSFSSLDEIEAGVRAIDSDYERHRQGARAIAAEYFDYRSVLTRLLRQAGVRVARRSAGTEVKADTSRANGAARRDSRVPKTESIRDGVNRRMASDPLNLQTVAEGGGQ